MKKIFLKTKTLIFSLSVFLLIPLKSTEAALVTCGINSGDQCDFYDVINLISAVIQFIFGLIVPIAAIMFTYAGFLLLFSGGNSGKKEKAKEIFVNVALGLVIALAAWLIVNTILSTLGADVSWIGFGN